MTSLKSTEPRIVESTDAIPRVFLVVPPLKQSFGISLHQTIRVVAPCQSPSIYDGSNESFHMTEHDGYTIKYPREFEHRHRGSIKFMAKAAKFLVKGAETAENIMSTIGLKNVPSLPKHSKELANSTLTSIQQKVDNKVRLDRTGIRPDSMFTTQLITDEVQKVAMTELLQSAVTEEQQNITGDLKGIVLEDGRSIWVCDRCYDCLNQGKPIDQSKVSESPQYSPLVRRKTGVEVTLRNSTSVNLFAETFAKTTKAKKIVINIESGYFEAPGRTTGAPFNSIMNLFNKLGQVLQNQKKLLSLEIRGNSKTNGAVYAGLKAALKCQTLERLCISGIPSFLQGSDISIKCRRLKELRLRGVHVNTEQTARNLRTLIDMNPRLRKFVAKRAEFTSTSLATVFKERQKELQEEFSKLNLESPSSHFGKDYKTINPALTSDNSRLRNLVLSGNPKVPDGCHRMWSCRSRTSKKRKPKGV
ncbi:hypothetical protein B0O80DRAFT_447511 [Mortierella sp. GBAus27b]|nr:hypothetical protein BGX31_006330 [Mortierella sp. GBA43]KAI8356462.1 hypothetical protein B0O80DRAFT_447511 [Mortierella sp. GBAus27b]